MPFYSAYGLAINSELELPGVLPAAAGDDMTVRVGAIEKQPPEDFGPNGYYEVNEREAFYWWDGVGRFHVANGDSIVVDPAPGADRREILSLILGPFIAIIMHQRGRLVLHGSGVEVDGGVIAFIADSGGGKSTTAAAFMAAGYPVVSDDLLPIELDVEGAPLVYPGGTQIKLWPEAIEAIGRDPEGLPRVIGPRDKRMLGVDERLAGSTPIPLRAIYVLRISDALAIEPLAPNEALVELARNSFVAPLVDQMGTSKRHFMQLAELVRRVPVISLERPLRLEMLGEVVKRTMKYER
jgi:hypothetical protein